MAYGAIIGGLIAAGGQYAASRQSSGASASTVRRRGRYVLNNIMEPRDRELFGKAQRQMEAVPETIKGGYRLARKEVGNSFRGATRSAIDQGQMAQGDALSRLSNSGYSGASSIAANMRLGVGYGTSRAIQNIQDRVAQIGANLATGEARDVAGAQTGLGQFYMQRARAERERDMLHWQLLTGLQPTNAAGAVDFQGLGQLFAGLNFGGQNQNSNTANTGNGNQNPNNNGP